MGPVKIANNLGLILTCYTLSLILMPLFLFLCVFFYLLRCLLNIFLKLLHGNTFLGLLQGSDSIWILGVPHESAIDLVIVLSLNSSEPKDIAVEFKKRISATILKDKNRYPKLTSTIHGILGYGYLLRSNCKADEIVSTIEITEDSEDYSKTYAEIFSKYGRNKLPANDTLMWEIVTVDASTSWKTKQNLKENQYPVLIRIHHIVGDGVSLAENLINIFSDKPVDITKNISKSMKLSLPKQPSFVEKSLYFLHMVMLTPGFLVLRKFRTDGDAGAKIFDPRMVSGDRDFYFVNDDSGTAIETIKRIKRNVGDTRFIEIILTAVSRSLQNLFSNEQLEIPDIAVQVLPFISSTPNSEKQELTNTYSLFRFPIPILVNSDSFVQRLNEVKRYSRSARNDIDFQVRNFCWNHLCGLWSAYLIIPLEKLENLSMCFSNLPACPKLTCLGFDIDHINFVPPEYVTLGFHGTFFTYNNKLHVSIGIDKNYLKSIQHSRKIANDIFENIKLFDEEVSKI